VHVGGRNEDAIAVNGDAFLAVESRARAHIALESPEQLAVRRIQRFHDIAVTEGEHDSVANDGRHHVVAVRQGPGPDELQLGDVVAVDLVERTESVRIVRAAPLQPIVRRRTTQCLIGDGRKFFDPARGARRNDERLTSRSSGHCFRRRDRQCSQQLLGRGKGTCAGRKAVR
jgi:hypothetical protein